MSELFPDYRSPWESDDQAMLRKHAADFFRKELTPNVARWAANHEVDRDFWNKAGAAGLLCLDIPETYGGGGGDFGHEAIVQQELAKAQDGGFGFAVHSTIVAHYLNTYATDEQKKRWLPKCASGESVLAIAMTEPGTGSDLQGVRTTAVREGDHYVVNGSKTFISNASHCDLLVIVAKTDPTQGAKGISLLVAETDGLEGFGRGRVLEKIGQHGQDTRELAFTDMRVPVENLLGGVEGQGFYQLMNQLQRERLILGVGGIAVAEAAVTEAISYAKHSASRSSSSRTPSSFSPNARPRCSRARRSWTTASPSRSPEPSIRRPRRWPNSGAPNGRARSSTVACRSSAATATWWSTRSPACTPMRACSVSTGAPARS